MILPVVHFLSYIFEYIPLIKLSLLSLCIVFPKWKFYSFRKNSIVIPSLQRDSGGPLMCQLPGQDNWTLFGITSLGVTLLGIQCGAVGSPGVYTRVVNYIDWIQNILNWND